MKSPYSSELRYSTCSSKSDASRTSHDFEPLGPQDLRNTNLASFSHHAKRAIEESLSVAGNFTYVGAVANCHGEHGKIELYSHGGSKELMVVKRLPKTRVMVNQDQETCELHAAPW